MRARAEGPGRLRLKGTQSYISSQRLSLQKHPRNICSLDSFPSAFMLKRNRADAAVVPSFLIGETNSDATLECGRNSHIPLYRNLLPWVSVFPCGTIHYYNALPPCQLQESCR